MKIPEEWEKERFMLGANIQAAHSMVEHRLAPPPGQPKAQPVVAATGALFDAIGSLTEDLDRLEGQLVLVLSPPEPSVQQGAGTPKGGTGSLAEIILSAVDRITAARRQIEALSRRIEV